MIFIQKSCDFRVLKCRYKKLQYYCTILLANAIPPTLFFHQNSFFFTQIKKMYLQFTDTTLLNAKKILFYTTATKPHSYELITNMHFLRHTARVKATLQTYYSHYP